MSDSLPFNILEVKNIHKTYARREVVNDVSFSVRGGEIVGLIGPNGAGKTTCFYIAWVNVTV